MKGFEETEEVPQKELQNLKVLPYFLILQVMFAFLDPDAEQRKKKLKLRSWTDRF
jgi:hypothetical protein